MENQKNIAMIQAVDLSRIEQCLGNQHNPDQIRAIINWYRMFLHVLLILEGKADELYANSTINKVWHMHAYGNQYLLNLDHPKLTDEYIKFSNEVYGCLIPPQEMFLRPNRARVRKTELLIKLNFTLEYDSVEEEVEAKSRNNPKIIPL